MMLASAMWYQTGDTADDTRVYNLGVARFTAEELYTSLMTALTVAPVNSMIVQLFRMEAPLSAAGPGMSIRNTSWQGRLKRRLHRWAKYVAWMTVFLVSTSSAFFVLLYSMDWGKEKSDSWMKAFILSFMGTSCVMDTLQIVVLAAVLSAVCSLPFLARPPGIRKEDLKLNLWNSAAPKKIHPPTKPNCQAAKKKRELGKKSTKTFKELLLLVVFVVVLFYIAQTNNDQRIFYETGTLSTAVLREYDTIRTPDQFYTWAEEVLLPTLYPSAWYNGRKMKFLDRQFAQNTESFRVGPPRLNQDRRRPDATPWENGAGLGWSLCQQNLSYSCWRFTVPDLLNHPNHTFNCTNHHSMDLPLDHDTAVAFFRALKDSEFLDKYTKSLSIDINFYNPAVKLFSVVRIVLDHSGVGNLVPTATITSFGLFQYESDADYVNLCIHILFALLFSVMVFKEAKSMKNMGRKYYTSAWNALGCLSLIGTATVICVFIKRYTVAADTLAMIAETNGELGFERFVDLTTAEWWDACFTHSVGIVVFINTVALLRVVRFSQTIAKLLALPGIMKDELLSFLIVAAVAFMSFISAAYLIFGSHLKSYSDLYHTTFALFEMMLGRFFASDMLEANPLIGPIFFSAFMVCIFTLLMNFLMSIVCDAISADVDVDHDQDLADHMWSSVCAKFSLHSPTRLEEEPGELKMEKLQENLRIIREQLDESLDICESILPSRRRSNLDGPSLRANRTATHHVINTRCEVKIVIQHAEDD
ncbi:polycystin-2-like protein 2 [Branchiostoma floridae x Branchiostoma belcheri]